MSETQDQGRLQLLRRDLRPSGPGHVWAWIIVAVAIVIFTVITLWFVAGGAKTPEVLALSDRQAVHQLAQRWQQRWPQVPGPPEVYGEQAIEAVANGDYDVAARRTTMQLALDPDQADAWLRLIALSCLAEPPALTLSVSESKALLLAMSDVGVGLNAGLAWVAYKEGDRDGALAAVGSDPEHPLGQWLRRIVLEEAKHSADTGG